MKLIPTKCAICDSFRDYTVIYDKNFDEGDLNTDTFSPRRLPDRIHYQIVKCDKDGLIRSNFVLEEPSIHKLYRKSKFTYEDEAGNLADSYLAALQPILRELPKDARILEIGCGNGFLLKALYDRGYQNVFGMEPSADAVAKSDRTIRNRIVADPLKSGVFQSSTFHLICFFQLFDHISDPDKFLKICYDILLPGGFILAFNHDIEGLQAKILRERSPIIDIEHTYLYSKRTMQKVFEKHSFCTVRIYSPANIVSLKYLTWLSPVPKWIKTKLVGLKRGVLSSLLRWRMRIKLGNLCLIAKKAQPGKP